MRIAVRCVALALLLAALARLALAVTVIDRTGLQQDFSAFYTAGESLNYGYSPYANNLDRTPRVWDGIGPYRHSRFLYPPLVATLMRPLALLPYAAAKTLWTVLSLACLLAMVLLVRRLAGLEGVDSLLFFSAGAVSFFPLLCELDRGQMDLVTLVLLVLGVRALSAGGPARGAAAGGLFALATLLKLHIALLAPLLLLRRRWDALLGMAAGGMVLGLVSLAVNGPSAVEDYVEDQLPRISQYGESGTESMLLPLEVLHARFDGNVGVKDGRRYEAGVVRFYPNATLVRALSAAWPEIMSNLTPASLGLFGAGLVSVVLIIGVRPPSIRPPAHEELMFWQMAMALMLLTSPLTWTMNVVWLIPSLALAIAGMARAPDRATSIGAAVCGLGFLIAWAPDTMAYNVPMVLHATDFAKYIAAEAIVLFAAAYLVRRSMRAEAAGAGAPGA